MKVHVGQILNEKVAAKIYDKRIILQQGLKAKTNFSYTKRQLEKMLMDDEDLIEYELVRDEPELEDI